MLNRLMSFARRFRRDETGLSALEFAIICPVMLTSLLGAVEVSNGMLADRKVTLVTSTIADLTSQDKNVTNTEMNDIFAAGAAIMYPMGAAPLKMRVSSVVADSTTGVTTVEWSSGSNMPARVAGSGVVVPAGMVPNGASVIFAEVEYRYVSGIGEFLHNGVTVKDKFYLRPRRTLKVTRSVS
jgi:Flp pilus assembly protein TadG